MDGKKALAMFCVTMTLKLKDMKKRTVMATHPTALELRHRARRSVVKFTCATVEAMSQVTMPYCGIVERSTAMLKPPLRAHTMG